uniref:Type II toxin-antitoxin system HicA family toxin n=1 Tax=biofilter metagenome TaxID=1070537 RepID=A0A193SBM2_9ZZZZ
MRASPVKGWNISDVEKLCKEHDIELRAPSNGSHFKAISPWLNGHQTIPAKRPIKPVYINTLVAMVDAHLIAREKQGGSEE